MMRRANALAAAPLAAVSAAVLAAVTVALVLGAGRPALALSCVARLPQELLADAEAVAMVRTVTAPVIRSGRPERGYPHVFAVERVYKGALGERLVFTHNPLVGPDIAFAEGERYLVLLRRRDDGSFRTSRCTGTQKVSAELPLEWAQVLGAGYPPAGPGDPLPDPGLFSRGGLGLAGWVPRAGWAAAALLLAGAALAAIWHRRRPGRL